MPCTYNVTINTECVTMETQQRALITIVVEQCTKYQWKCIVELSTILNALRSSGKVPGIFVWF